MQSMGIQIRRSHCHGHLVIPPPPPPPLQSLQSPCSLCTGSSSATSLVCLSYQIARDKSQKYEAFRPQKSMDLSFAYGRGRRRRKGVGSSTGNVSAAAPLSWDDWSPDKGSKAPPLSDVVWPAAGAFVAMAVLGRMDQMLAAKGVSMTIAPLGAVCAVLFATPSSPAARKYNMFVAQIGCAAFGVLAFSMFGPGWIARSAGLAAAVAFMIYTRAIHPPAASLPILFIDGVKLHKLNFWYAFFPGAVGCILLCLIQEVVCYLKDNFKF